MTMSNCSSRAFLRSSSGHKAHLALIGLMLILTAEVNCGRPHNDKPVAPESPVKSSSSIKALASRAQNPNPNGDGRGDKKESQVKSSSSIKALAGRVQNPNPNGDGRGDKKGPGDKDKDDQVEYYYEEESDIKIKKTIPAAKNPTVLSPGYKISSPVNKNRPLVFKVLVNKNKSPPGGPMNNSPPKPKEFRDSDAMDREYGGEAQALRSTLDRKEIKGIVDDVANAILAEADSVYDTMCPGPLRGKGQRGQWSLNQLDLY